MKIETLEIQNFRNIEILEIEPNSHLNLFLGPNAQGKTSVLEAIYFLSHLQSFRNAKPGDLIRHGQSTGQVTGKLVLDEQNQDWKKSHRVRIEHTDLGAIDRLARVQKIAQIDDKNAKSTTDYLVRRSLYTVSFNPSDHELIQGEPRVRRSYLNQSIASEDPTYLQELKRFNLLLGQRNEALKTAGRSGEALLESFSPMYAASAAKILFRRLVWLSRLQTVINRKLQAIAPQQPELSLWYSSRALDHEKRPIQLLPEAPPFDLLEIENRVLSRLSEQRRAEVFQQVTLVGPHRDDFGLEMGQNPLKFRGSQGEIRSSLLALKLSEIELFLDTTQVKPVILLDDFSSELDFERRQFLLRYLQELNLQTFVTTTENLDWPGKRFQVKAGTVNEQIRGPRPREVTDEQMRN